MSCNLTATNINCTVEQLNEDFSGGVYLAAGGSLISTDPSGIISSSNLSNYISLIKTQFNINQPDFTSPTGNEDNSTNIAEYHGRLRTFFTNLNAEYNYYDARYRFSINKLFDALTTGLSGEIPTYTTYSRTLNRKLNILIQLTQGLAANAYDTAYGRETTIQDINAKLSERAKQINKHATILRNGTANMEIKQEMVKYTQEKARATENLLSLYFVLNVFAIGTLMYVYKAN
jgi:hypothetical protein